MRFHRILTPAALAACAALAVVAVPTTAGAASSPSLPQPLSAQAGATWLAGQFNAQGFIPSQSDPGTADLSATANGLLALVSSNTDPSLAATALSFLKENVNAYISQDGVDGPGQLALLILDAHAMGADPTSFGGSNLVDRLLATQEPSGKNAGLFGTKDQVNDFNAGDYDQGLALAALAATGNSRGSAIKTAESWLLNQQCPDGGWTSYESKNNPCDGSPADFEGPDTNSTALAIQGLAAQGDLGGTALTNAHAFLVHAQDSDGGWGFDPNTASTPGSTDPDSTALVLQAILALGDSPSAKQFDKVANPVSVLESFQSTSGPDQGSFSFPGVSGPNLLSTYQAVPAVAGVVVPFNLVVTTSSLPPATLKQPYKAKLAASGGNAPYIWSVEDGFGTLPIGLTLNSTTGAISGKPKSTGTSTFVVEVTDTKTTSQPQHDNVGWAVLSLTTSTG